MDNKITGSRLSNLFAYEWIIMILVLIAVILINQFVYGFFTAQISVGQSFKYLYEFEVDSSGDEDFAKAIINSNEYPFSYDVLVFSGEHLTNEADILSIRVAIQDCDIYISSGKEDEKGVSSLKKKIDNPSVYLYNFNKLILDAESYLKGFLKDEFNLSTEIEKEALIKDQANFSVEKIHARFLERMKKDNRYRTAEAKEEGKAQEVERIYQLIKEVDDFKYLLENKPEIFYTYTRFSQSLELAEEDKKEHYQKLVDNEIANESGALGENAPYGIMAEKLTGGKTEPSKYFKLKADEEKEGDVVYTAEGVVISVFDFLEYQEDLQFETISFLNAIVRECSNFLEGR